MGLIRVILALSVVIAHLGNIYGYPLIGPRPAVQSFFIISGFYMSLILTEKYVGKGFYKKFIKGRILRIYPLYLVILIITLVISLPVSLNFLGWLKNIALFPTLDYLIYQKANYGGLLVPQAWTLGLEMLFYFCAPFLVKRNIKVIGILTVLSLGSRFYFTHIINFYPWQFVDRFIPTELNFFLFGILAFKIYIFIKKIKLKPRVLVSIYLFFITVTLFYPFLTSLVSGRLIEWLYYLTLTFCLPFLFLFSKNFSWDRYFGDLSYPIYIQHALIILILVRINFSPYAESQKIVSILIILAAASGTIILWRKINLVQRGFHILQSRIF